MLIFPLPLSRAPQPPLSLSLSVSLHALTEDVDALLPEPLVELQFHLADELRVVLAALPIRT